VTFAECLDTLVRTRENLRAQELLNAGLNATAFSVIRTGSELGPELLVFHGTAEQLFPQQTLDELATAGITLTVFERDATGGLPKPLPAEELEYAEKVLASPVPPLCCGGRVYTDPNTPEVGTIGCLAKRNGVLGMVTCQHVTADSADGRLFWPRGDHVVAGPGAETVGAVSARTLYGNAFPDRPVTLDAAFVPLAMSRAEVSSQISGAGQPLRVAAQPLPDLSLIGRSVTAVGSTSGRRHGAIRGVLYEGYQDHLLTDYLIVSESGLPLSTGGDSGSVWLTADTLELVALNHSSKVLTLNQVSSVVALASNLDAVFRQLGLQLVNDM
jgi:hypothetical protein